MDMTINNTLTNPTGKGSGFVGARYAIINDLQRRYEDIKSDIKRGEAGVDGTSTLLHIQIPSEKDKYMKKQMYYDVIIKLDRSGSTDLKTGDVPFTVYSNSPAFTFTYCYVLNKEDALVSEFKKHCSPKALTDPPEERNPMETWGFEKSVYFALLYLKEKNFLRGQALFGLVTKDINMRDLLKKIPSSDDKLVEYNKIKEKVVKENKAERKKAKQIKEPESKKHVRTTTSRKTKRVTGMAKQSKQTGLVRQVKSR